MVATSKQYQDQIQTLINLLGHSHGSTRWGRGTFQYRLSNGCGHRGETGHHNMFHLYHNYIHSVPSGLVSPKEGPGAVMFFPM